MLQNAYPQSVYNIYAYIMYLESGAEKSLD